MVKEELEVIEITEQNIQSMVYEIREQKVMLDFDLARIYGYTTKRFNEQVKNNIEKFPEDFMFRLTREETEQLVKSPFVTARKSLIESEEISRSFFSTTIQTKGIKGGRVYLPYAFTEQGIYMLMTVLKGELAVKQSKALIRLFKRMKDYIIENALLENNASLINNKLASNDKRFEIVESKLDIVMNNFIDPTTYKRFLILVDQRVEADIAYQTIYQLAVSSLIIIDDYINVKTLQLLKICKDGVSITIITDNQAKDALDMIYVKDFIKDTNLDITIKKNNNMFHDRYIVVDYLKDNECIYHGGTSSKDAGNKINTIQLIEKPELYHNLFDEVLINETIL